MGAQVTQLVDQIRMSAPLGGTLTPEWSFLIIELLVYLFAVLCVRDALTRPDLSPVVRRRWLGTMVFAALLTLTIEMLLSHQVVPSGTPPVLHRLYTYPPDAFLIQIFDVPLWVPVGWSFILYATMRTSTLLGMRWYLAPLLDGFLALNLDLTLDPVAIHRGWWTWNVMQDPASAHLSAYYGIPLVNFMGWFVIVASFSFFSRWLWRKDDAKNGTRAFRWSALALLLSLPAVMGYQAVATGIMSQEVANPGLMMNGMLISTLIWLAGALVVVWNSPEFRRNNPVQWLLISVPVAFHSFDFFLLWVTRAKSPPAAGTGMLVHEASELVIFMPVAALLGLWLYCWPYLDVLRFTSRRSSRG